MEVVRASSLPRTGLLGPQPYCLLSVGAASRRTSTSSGTSPRWNQALHFPLTLPAGLTLNIDLFDSDVLTEDDFLGHTCLDLGEAEELGSQEVRLELDNGGQLLLRTQW